MRSAHISDVDRKIFIGAKDVPKSESSRENEIRSSGNSSKVRNWSKCSRPHTLSVKLSDFTV